MIVVVAAMRRWGREEEGAREHPKQKRKQDNKQKQKEKATE